MRQMPLLLLIIVARTFAVGQINVSVSTDKPLYKYGETVAITVTAHNPTADTVRLRFRSTCQANYRIGAFNLISHIICFRMDTYRTLAPFASFTWPAMHYPGRPSWPLLKPGIHMVVGEVLQHAISSPVAIVVDPLTSASATDPQVQDTWSGSNYPNPFNGTTSIQFVLPRGGRVKLTVYSALGVKVRTMLDENRPAGTHIIQADLSDQPSGVYWCHLEMTGKRHIMKLLLLR